MTNQQRAISAVLLLTSASMVSPAVAQSTSGTEKKESTHHHKAHHRATREHRETAAERATREQLAAMQSQIDALKQQVADKDTALTAAQQSAQQANDQSQQALAAAQAANASLATNQQATVELKDKIASVQQTNTDLATTITETQRNLNERIDSPSALHYKGVTITPGGFFAMEGVWRQHSVNSDINTPFNAIPFPGSDQGHVSELNFSARQSRLSMLVEGKAATYKLTGYFEGDFLSAGVTSNNNQSNSYTFRQRQFWGQGAKGGFAVTGGQMWTLATEDGRGTDNRTEKLPQTIDPQYMVGYTWARQPGIRFQQRWGDYKTGAVTAAMSLEQAQITNFTATSATAGAVPSNFFFGGTGQGGGLYNAFNGTYANNVAPDVLVKVAYDNAHAHAEIGGIARFLRDNYYPITGTTVSSAGVASYTYSKNQTSDTKAAGGVFGSVRVSPSHYVDAALSLMAGQGVGRYGSAQLADATIHPDGTLEPIRNYHGLFSLETHPTKKLDIFAYYGGEYAQRTVYAVGSGAFAGALIGYGAPNLSNTGCYALPANPGGATAGNPGTSGCSSPTRYIQEGMAGFIYKMINDPKYGRLQYSMTYSYIQRNLWSGIGNTVTPAGPRAEEPMVHASFRYYIP